MSYVTLGDLLLVLEDLRNNKQESVEKTLSFQLFGPTLNALFDRMENVQAALTQKPLSEELKDADWIHDASAKAVYYICKALAELPMLDAESRAFLVEVQKTFVPGLSPLSRSYEDEAATAKKRLGALDAMKPRLEAFPVAPNVTLFTLVSAHLNAGVNIDTLLSSRAAAVAEDEAGRARDAGALRSQVIGALNRFRESLIQEVSVDPVLPRDLAEVTFSYYDQLTATREGRAKPGGESPDAPEETP